MPLSKETHVLIVDDDEDDFLIISDYLKEINSATIHITWASNYEKGIEQICEKKYIVCLVDYFLGAKTGLDFTEEAIRLRCDGPIILMTGKGDHEIDRQAMLLGAADYLIKSEIDAEKLERSIRYSLGHFAAMKALSASEQKYRNIFERSKDSIFIADLSLNFKDANRSMLELLGLSSEEFLGRSFYEFIDEDREKLKQEFVTSSEVVNKEVTLRNAQGKAKLCRVSISIQNDHEEDTFAHGIIHDITLIKKVEQASSRAERLAATGRLIRTLAHEVRNPLNNIHISIDQLLDSHKTDENSLFLEIIKRNSKRIGDQLNELLASSYPAEMHMQGVVLQEVLDESMGSASDRITLAGVKVTRNYPKTPCYVEADRAKIKLAFLNIIINAIEAMRDSDGELIVSINDLPSQYVIEISDNGHGIPAENLPNVFEPYFTSKRNGTGLGLAATFNILQAHKASIDVASQQEKGTTFSITLNRGFFTHL